MLQTGANDEYISKIFYHMAYLENREQLMQKNPTGEKGKGGMASSNLGKGRKGSPCLKNIETWKYYCTCGYFRMWSN